MMNQTHSLLPFLMYLPIWLFFIFMNWAGFKLMDYLARQFSVKILTENSFVKELLFWSFLSLIASLTFCFIITNYGALLKRYDYIRLIYVFLNYMILYFTFWYYNFKNSMKLLSFEKYESKVRNRNILFFVLFNLIGHMVGLSTLFSYNNEYSTGSVIESERISSLITLIVTIALSSILILIRQKRHEKLRTTNAIANAGLRVR